MNKKILIPIILIILCLVAVGIYSSTILDKVNQVEIPDEDQNLGIIEKMDAKENNKITNIALFGTDSRSPEEKGRADSIMIASLDRKHKK